MYSYVVLILSVHFKTNWCLQTPKCQNGTLTNRARHECGCFGGIRIPIKNTKSLRGFRIGSRGHLYGPPTPVQKLLLFGTVINWSLPIKRRWLGCLCTRWATHQAFCLMSAHRNWDRFSKLLLFGVAKNWPSPVKW